ncbi:hypothetical protein [Jiangella mangrovi]|uniref:LPXTG cell wall anchor domain-containing protein n=1 Tax=Jiangella mangrovi TaxID=1524084 RepID=A0A7W9GPV2_9ACTN|nr:hypothetical protein [Jiangella mangrovi]MBB5787613.1 hypothetical protein [Jiangella mangrovi]
MSNVSRRRSPRRRLVTAVGVVILATGGFAGTAAAASGTGPEGQTVTVSKVDGLTPGGETVTVHGEGFDLTKGIYVVVCVNTGAGQQPTPCLGGADMEGGGGASAWISSNPPSYGEGLAQPFEEEGGRGSFSVQLNVVASDEFTDCLDPSQAPNGCVIGTRADHTRTADRSADVLLPITFAGAGGAENGDDGGDAGGRPSPSPSSTTGAAGGGSDLAQTGAPIVPAALAGLALLGGGVVAVAVRRRTEETIRP